MWSACLIVTTSYFVFEDSDTIIVSHFEIALYHIRMDCGMLSQVLCRGVRVNENSGETSEFRLMAYYSRLKAYVDICLCSCPSLGELIAVHM